MVYKRNTSNLSASSIIAGIEERIRREKLILEANQALRNDDECIASLRKIAVAKIMLLRFSGDLPL